MAQYIFSDGGVLQGCVFPAQLRRIVVLCLGADAELGITVRSASLMQDSKANAFSIRATSRVAVTELLTAHDKGTAVR